MSGGEGTTAGPSAEMQELLRSLRQRQADDPPSPPSLAEQRAGFAPAGQLHPIPDDVRVTGVSADGVPAYWLDAPGVDADRALLFCRRRSI